MSMVTLWYDFGQPQVTFIFLTFIDQIRNAEIIDRPEYSQPLSTAIQIALIELLNSFGVAPAIVVGHSSGEIAAA